MEFGIWNVESKFHIPHSIFQSHMRIAILTNSFPPDGRGGAERIAWMQAEGLRAQGHEVTVWAPGEQDRRTAGPQDGIQVERFASLFGELSKMPMMRRLAYHVFFDVGARKDVVRRIIESKPDVLMTHNLTGCGMGTGNTVHRTGVRWIHTLHDIQLTDPSGQETVAFSKTIAARVWRWKWGVWRRLFFGTPDVVVSSTQWLLDWHWENGWFKNIRTETRVIPNPNPSSVVSVGERKLHLPATIAFVGRLSRDKGFDAVAEMLPRLQVTIVRRMVAAGDGDLRTAGQQDHRIEYRGQLSPDDAHRVIAEADLLIAPSRILENQQTVLIEAMAEGTPVVATDTGGTKETLDGTGCPVISTGKGMADEMERAIVKLLADQNEWSRVSGCMRERGKRHEPAEYVALISGLLEKRSPGF
jgi:glycosyltransferase involved in cell wall biosynthesis